MTSTQQLAAKGFPNFSEAFATKVLATAAALADDAEVGIDWMIRRAIDAESETNA